MDSATGFPIPADAEAPAVPSGPRARVARGLDRLEKELGRPRRGRVRRPLDELILTILSQNTSDGNRDRAYRALRGRYATWDDVLRARRDAVEHVIRVGGLARTKSRVIRDVLRRVRDERGTLSLDFLRTVAPDEARSYLSRFRGVGEKTTCCVMLFACGHPAFPVDTHIHRVTRRLGWVPSGADTGRSHEVLARLIPADRYLSAHLNLITVGRRFCRPTAPACPRCPLRSECRHARRAPRGVKRAARRGRT